MIRLCRESIRARDFVVRAILVTSVLAAVGVPGCGPRNPKTYPVRGTVVFKDGAPVTWGTIEFHPVGRQAAARAEIQSDGSFALSTYGQNDGAVPGKYQVTVVQLMPVDQPFKHQHAHPPGVARKHSNPLASGLSETVSADHENVFKIEVESESGRAGK